jgi:hypothetical protein
MAIGGDEPWRTDTPNQQGIEPDSLDSLLFEDSAPILSDHAHFLSSKARVFDSHSEEHVLVFLVIGSKGVLVEQNLFGVFRAHLCEVRELPSDGSDQMRLALHAFFVCHRRHENKLILSIGDFHGCGAGFGVFRRMIDPSIEACASGGECIETLLHFFDRNVFLLRRNRPCAAEWIEDAPFP